MVGRYFIVYGYIHSLHSVVSCSNGVARTSVATSKVDLLSGEVQRWSDGQGGHGNQKISVHTDTTID